MNLLLDALRCPDCRLSLVEGDGELKCAQCALTVPKEGGRLHFIEVPATTTTSSDAMFAVKQWIKRYPAFYKFLLYVISPVCPTPWRMRRATPNIEEGAIALHLGSGPSTISPRAWNLDIFPYPNVDIVCDALRLPFADASVDVIVNIAMLEHVTDPQAIVAEMRRVLKPGGKVFTVVPFLQCYHDSPRDYYRWTLTGLERLHGDFEPVEAGVLAGPASSLCWTAQELAASLFSFGIAPLYRLLQVFFMLLLFPIKILDLLLVHIPSSANAASVLYFQGVVPRNE